ncbi:hypothetical protein E2C01_097458 [Portunus trituberculatus]|uniref:Uncharacterized protein n=1 Tax=Portunus trituberculatus TaxID=210409 RepID=A0A5B7K9Z6_PORTR|nr:hypothetical protein [Portunus trituberculatus]
MSSGAAPYWGLKGKEDMQKAPLITSGPPSVHFCSCSRPLCAGWCDSERNLN